MRAAAVRALDGGLAALLALTLVVIVTGGFAATAGPVHLDRAEDVFVAAVGVAAIRHWLRPFPLPGGAGRRTVLWAVAAYTAVFSFVTVTRHFKFRTHALDLGIYDQITWGIARGRGPWTSLPEMHGWGDHFTIILYLLAPLYLVVDSVVVLLVVQSLALALGALAVWGYARRALGEPPPAAALAVLFLLSPTLHGVNIRDFHPQALAIPLLLAAVCFFEIGRPVLFWASVLLALATREDAALPVLGLGLWALVARRRYWTGAVAAALGLAWLFVTTGLVIPYFRGAPYPHLKRYAHLGGSVGEIALGVLRHPLVVLATLATLSRLKYLLAMLAPLGFLPLVAPLAALPALPALVQNLLSADPVLFHHRAQYTVYVLPFLAIAAVDGFRRLARWKGPAAARTVLGFAFLAALALGSRTLNDLMVSRWWPDERDRAIRAVLARVPPRVAVAAGERFVPHLSHRDKVFVFPTGIERSEWVVLDAASYPSSSYPDHRLEVRDGAATMSLGPAGPRYEYEVVAEGARVLLLRRTGG